MGCLHVHCIVLLYACLDWIFVLSHKLILSSRSEMSLLLIESFATCYHGGLTPQQDDIHLVIYKYSVYLSSVWWQWKITSQPFHLFLSVLFMFCFLHKKIGNCSPIHDSATVETIWLVPCDRASNLVLRQCIFACYSGISRSAFQLDFPILSSFMFWPFIFSSNVFLMQLSSWTNKYSICVALHDQNIEQGL